jgi:nicotinamide N-methyltransferase
MADYICLHKDEFRGRRVLELGAAAALPSVLCLTEADASYVLATDYPAEELVQNMNHNMDTLVPKSSRHRIGGQGFLWGDSAFLDSLGEPFDVVLLCDVVFNHSEHSKLLHSCRKAIKPDGVIWVTFTHYRPWLKDRDRQFLSLAASQGFSVQHVQSHLYEDFLFPEDLKDPRISDPDDLRTVHAYCLRPIASPPA